MGTLTFAQSQGPNDVALRYLEEHTTEWGLTNQDISDLELDRYYFGKKEKIHHFYFVQRHQGIKVHNAVTSIHVNTKGKAYNVGHRFVANLASKVNSNHPKLNQQAAVLAVLDHLEVPSANFNFESLEKSGHKVSYDKGEISRADINVDLVYQEKDGQYILAWDVSVDPVAQNDYWSIE